MPNVKINRRAERHEREGRDMKKRFAMYCAVGCIVLLSFLFVSSIYAGGKRMKNFYITAPWAQGKVIVVNGNDRLDAITRASITVWTEEEWGNTSYASSAIIEGNTVYNDTGTNKRFGTHGIVYTGSPGYIVRRNTVQISDMPKID